MSRSSLSPMSPSGHVAPEALVRRLDEAASPDEVAAIEHHLSACDSCREEAERIERLNRDFGALLVNAYPAVPTTWQPPARRQERSSWWWPMAAIIATIIAVGAVAPPVRAWVSEHLLSILGGAEEPPPIVDATGSSRPGQDDAPDGSGNVVVFQPGGPEFTIDVSGMITGQWTLAVSAGGAATAEILRGAPPEIVVLPNGLRVMADSALEADLRLNLPAAVRRIVVRVDGRFVRSYDVDAASPEASQRWDLRLRRSR